MALAFLEPGTDATQDVSWYPFINIVAGGTASSSSVVAHTGTRSLRLQAPASGDYVAAFAFNVLADTGRVSFWLYLNVAGPFGLILQDGSYNGHVIFALDAVGHSYILTNNSLDLLKNLSTIYATGRWYHITLSYVITAMNNFTIRVFADDVLDGTVTQANGTLSGTGLAQFAFEANNLGGGAACDNFIDDVYIDDGATLDNPGAVVVTAKRPNANGTTTGFTTQIGSGGSGYGSGHSPQVNEQPLSTTNGWSMVGVGAAVTEEYNIERWNVGDITNGVVIGVQGWVYAKSLASETGKIVVDGTQTNIALTSTPTLFVTGSATPTVYPAGTGTDIGIVTATDLTTVSLYECGILIATVPRRFLMGRH